MVVSVEKKLRTVYREAPVSRRIFNTEARRKSTENTGKRIGGVRA